MRRSYISPEYDNNFVNGSYNMVEQSVYFSSKVLNTEDTINIDNTDIIWYQRPTNEQLDFSIESSLDPYFYSSSDSKKENHTIFIDDKQSDFQRSSNTRWVLYINIKKILHKYLFASMKKYRSFEGLRNDMTIYNDVDIALSEYINKNVIDRYKFSKTELFFEKKELGSDGVKRFNPIWNDSLDDNSKLSKFQLTDNDSIIKISFEQPDSSQFTFEYYFNIIFEKI